MTEFSPSGQTPDKTSEVLDAIDETLAAADYAPVSPTPELTDTAELREPNALRRAGRAVVRFAARLVSPEARAQHQAENHQAEVAARAFLEDAAPRYTIGATRLPESQDVFRSPASEKWGRHTRN